MPTYVIQHVNTIVPKRSCSLLQRWEGKILKLEKIIETMLVCYLYRPVCYLYKGLFERKIDNEMF